MLNHSLKRTAIERYKQTVRQYDETVESVRSQAVGLHELRLKCSRSAIEACEAYVTTLANSPKEFDKGITEFKIEYGLFTQLLKDLQRENVKHEVIGGSMVGAAGAVGFGVAALGPSAAMAVATTFGVASTGTAISALSGAAATNAALAWLGGGALAAGGTGVAGGSALLVLAGPIGWGIAGAGFVVGGVAVSRKNAQVAKKATEATVEVHAGIALLQTAQTEIRRLSDLTTEHSAGVTRLLAQLSTKAPRDYLAFSQDDKEALAALINNVRALSMLLNRSVE